jgi:hypothetical protein
MLTDDEMKGGAGGEDERADKVGGEETRVERVLNRWVGDAIHLFFSPLSVFILAATAVAAYEAAVTDFPKLTTSAEKYDSLQKVIRNVLLIAIAAELVLLMLFHRTSAAVEAIIFVIAQNRHAGHLRARTGLERRFAVRLARRPLLLPAG